MTRPALDVLREAVRRAVAASSQRAVAAQIGVSHVAVGKFLAGSEPYEATRRKLQAWYLRRVVPPDAVSTEVARVAAFILLDAIPQAIRAAAVQDLVRAAEAIHRDAGVEPPGWIGELLSGRPVIPSAPAEF